MLDILNPCNDPNAWWQQLLMLAGPFLLGWLWPKGNKQVAEASVDLTERIAAVEADLADCKSNTAALQIKITDKTATANIANIVAANGLVATGQIQKPTKKDDLKVVEGIGPKIESLFNEAGILSFSDLANTSADRLKEILFAAGSRFQMHDPTTWPAQSKLAAEGKWQELKKWQDELNAGQA